MTPTINQKAREIVSAGWVTLTEGGGSVRNADGFIYRVDLSLNGRPNCQCRGFEYSGHCKHLAAVEMAMDDAMWEAYEADNDQSEEDYDRLADLIIDAGLPYGVGIESAVYALWE